MKNTKRLDHLKFAQGIAARIKQKLGCTAKPRKLYLDKNLPDPCW